MEKQNALLFYIVIGILTFSLFNCGQNKATNGNELVFIKGNKRIELILEGGEKFLVLNKPTKLDFVIENIDNINYSIAGAGIKKIGSKDSDFEWEITPPKEHITDGKLKIRMIVALEDEENLNVEFLVDVKESE